jgi:hypothetical protein
MAVSQVVITSPAPEVIFTDNAMGAIVDTVKTSNGIVYYVTVDNSLNTLVPSYVKLYFALAANVTIGSTVPNDVIYVAARAKETRRYLTGAAFGRTFPVALSALCVTTGGTFGSISPTNPVQVTISYM